MASKDLIVYRRYTFYKVSVDIEINHLEKKISVVEWDSRADRFKPKDWCFADRTQEYINGWGLIFRALEKATQEAKKELESRADEELQETINIMSTLKNVELKNGKKAN